MKVNVKKTLKSRLTVSALCLSGSLWLVVPNAQATESQLSYIAMTPCRAVDTRGIGTSGKFGTPSMLAGIPRDFQLWASPNCIGIPSTVKAYSLNITVVPSTGELSYLTIWPAGAPQPVVSTLNSPFGSVVANAATITAGSTDGSVSVYVTDITDVIIDVNGYYTDLSGSIGPTGATGPTGPAGAAGASGPIGLPGIQGIQGAIGATGATGAAGLGYQGVWNSGTTYAVADTVYYKGSSYISLQPSNAGAQPDTLPNTSWSLLVQGALFSGAFSPLAAYSVGNIVTYAGSSYYSITAHALSPTTPNVDTTNWLPLAKAGATGATGAAGPTGPIGVTGAAGPIGPIGATGASTGLTIGGQFNYAPNSTVPPFYFPINSSGDPTFGGTVVSFADAAMIMGVACTVDAMYVYQAPSSGQPITLSLWLQHLGTGTISNTGLSVTAGNGSESSNTSATISVNPGDLLSFHLDTGAGVSANGAILTTSIHCTPTP